MPDDPDSPIPERRTWLERLGQAFSGEVRSREELIEELRTAQSNGLLAVDTLGMIEGAMAVAELQVADVMIPRAQMVAVPVSASLTEVLRIVTESGHSRFPVQGEDKDEILGVLLAKDLLRAMAEDLLRGVAEHRELENIRELLRPVVLIPESKRLNLLLKEFRLSRNHMAIVVDEYGGVAGLITIEDVLEEIVGEIDDEHDEAQDNAAQIAAQADGQFMVDALTPITDFNQRFGADFSDDDYDTIGGLVTDALGHLPEAGEELTLARFNFRVARADRRRVHSFIVSFDVHE
jgi:magnesium and cobalt transporter